MAVAINQPQARQDNKESDLDRLAKLVGIGTNIMQGYDVYKQMPQRDAQAQLAQNQLNQSNQALAMQRRLDSGQLNAEDVLPLGEKYSFSDTQSPGSMRVSIAPQAGTFNPNEPASPVIKYISQKRDELQPFNIEKIKADTAKAKAEAAKAYAEARNFGSGKKQYDNMPKEQQIGIEKIAGRQANQLGIANSIDSTIKVLDDNSVNQDQKLMQARQLIKVLNSQEGQDAVGAEEAKRLAGMIEYRIFNFTEPGAFIGRDLPGFTDQAKITANSLRNSAKENQALIEAYKTGQVGQSFDKRYAVEPKETKTKIGSMPISIPQANAAQPQTVMQNGHTYTFNPKSGRYE